VLRFGPNDKYVIRTGRRSERDPDVPEDRIIGVRVSPGTIEIRTGTVKLVPSDILQPDACIQPWPKRWAATHERQIGNLADPVGAVRASGKGAIERRIRSAADRHSPPREAPGFIIDIGKRSIQEPQLVVGIVGEPERLARARVMILVNPGDAGSNSVRITEILILGIDPNICEGVGARARQPNRKDL